MVGEKTMKNIMIMQNATFITHFNILIMYNNKLVCQDVFL